MLQFLDRQEDSFLKGIFNKFAGISGVPTGDYFLKHPCTIDGLISKSMTIVEPCIGADGLQAALLELGVHMERRKVEELIAVMDLDESGGLDYEEFKRAVQQTPTQLEQWASMLPLGGLLARSLPVSGGQGDQPLRDFSQLKDIQIKTIVDVFSEGLTLLLFKAQATSKQMFNTMDKRASETAKDSADGVAAISKFTTFKMRTGNVSNYHEGLLSRIGVLHLPWFQSIVHFQCLPKWLYIPIAA